MDDEHVGKEFGEMTLAVLLSFTMNIKSFTALSNKAILLHFVWMRYVSSLYKQMRSRG